MQSWNLSKEDLIDFKDPHSIAEAPNHPIHTFVF